MGRANTPVAVLYPKGRRAGTQSDEAHVGPYELIGEIGRGGMGTVYLAGRAGHAGFRRLFALKLMHQHLAEDLDFLTMFLDEARIAAKIHHANVVSILDLDDSSRGYFVVMDYVEGCSLAQLLARSASYRTPRVLSRVAIDFLLGLHAAHSLRDERDRPLELVHRDVSPANVLIGVDGVARITDFGVAKARARIASTQPGVHKGTLSYASPEQLRSRRLVDARTDVWASGVLLWNSLTGRSLFRGDSDAQTVHRILHRKVPPPSRIGLKPPPFFDEICLRALDRDPQKRFRCAEEMADALHMAAAAHGVLGSQRELGACVTESFALEFAARRKAIRDAERRQGTHTPPALVPELPELATPLPNLGSASESAAEEASSTADYEEVRFEFVPAGAPAVMSERSAAELAPKPRRFGRALRVAMAAALLAGSGAGALAYRSWNADRDESAEALVGVLADSADSQVLEREAAPVASAAVPAPAVDVAVASPSPVPEEPAATPAVAASEPDPVAAPAVRSAPERARIRKPARKRAAPPAPAAKPRAEPDEFHKQIAAALRAQRRGRFDEALGFADRAIAIRRAGRGFQVKADILMQRGDTAAALDAADTAVALAPRSARAWLTKGMLHYELKQYPEAKVALERNLRLRPDGRDAQTVRLIVEEL